MLKPGMENLWHGDQLDLDGYLSRIGYAGQQRPTLAALRTLHRAHVLSFPFENLDPVLGRPVSLDMAAVQEKFLRSARGGYCYEHVTLFAAVLERFGFGLTGLSGRIRLDSGKILPATHATLRVQADDAELPWLCDVGFGSSPLTPLPLADGAQRPAGDWHYRLGRQAITPDGDGWLLYAWDPAQQRWFERHSFTLDPQYPVDYEVGSHFIDSHPHSPFVRRPFLQRAAPDRAQVLDGLTLRTWYPADGTQQERELAVDEVPETLDTVFGIRPDPDTTTALLDTLTP